MNEELTKWFKDNCKDVGHVNYGKIKEIIAKHEAKKEVGDRKLNALMGKHDEEKPDPSIQAPEFVLRSEGCGFLRKDK